MNPKAIVKKIDAFQQRHPVLAFPYAIVKKFGDDNGGYQAALLTYYGFLSLFPLLLVLVTVLQLWFSNNPTFQEDISQNLSNYFPMLGDQLQNNVQGMDGKTGIGLIVGLVLTIYGARGVADALRFALDNMWQVPKKDRTGFPKSIGQSLIIMGVSGIGFLATVAASSITSALGHDWWLKVLLNILSAAILAGVLTLTFRIATSKHVALKDMVWGATIAAVIIQLLLTFGSILVAHQLKGLDSLYGTFAIVLGLLFWIYLLAQVLVYSAEIDTVRHFKLWPRGMDSDEPTKGDERAYRLYAKSENYIPIQKVKVRFKKGDKENK